MKPEYGSEIQRRRRSDVANVRDSLKCAHGISPWLCQVETCTVPLEKVFEAPPYPPKHVGALESCEACAPNRVETPLEIAAPTATLAKTPDETEKPYIGPDSGVELQKEPAFCVPCDIPMFPSVGGRRSTCPRCGRSEDE